MNANLENELMTNIKNLTNIEQIEIKLMISIFINNCEKIKKEKVKLFENSLKQQIEFYGRKISEYQLKINELTQKYETQIDKILSEYNIRYVAIIKELQETQCNQKISIANIKISIDTGNDNKLQAAMAKEKNYEIIIQECFRQLTECNESSINKLNEIFYNKDNQLIVGKPNLFQKVLNIFNGKNKIEQMVIGGLYKELENLENDVNNQISIINDETIHNIAIIKDAQIQTQTIFNQMMSA